MDFRVECLMKNTIFVGMDLKFALRKKVKNSTPESDLEALRVRINALRSETKMKPNVFMPNSFVSGFRLPRIRLNASVRDLFLILLLSLILFDIGRRQIELIPFRYVAPKIAAISSLVEVDQPNYEKQNYNRGSVRKSLINVPGQLEYVSSMEVPPQIAPETFATNFLSTFILKERQTDWFDTSSGFFVSSKSDPKIEFSYPVKTKISKSETRPSLNTYAPNSPLFSHEIFALVDKKSQRIRIYKQGDQLYEWAVSTARQGKVTPTGIWNAQWLSKNHKSSLYNNAPMPYSIFFNGHYAIHGTYDVDKLGLPASAGCVRLHPDNAEILFAMVQDVGKANFAVQIVE